MTAGTLARDSLGNHAKFAAALDQTSLIRLERFELQSYARRITPAHRVARCLWCRRHGEEFVKVWHNAKELTAHYGGLQTCGSVWDCPVCAAKITERRRLELAAAVKKWWERGGWVAIGAFTYSHYRFEALQTGVQRFLGAQRALTADRGFKGWKRDRGLSGVIRSREVTWGEENGWHPHCHWLMFFDAGHPPELVTNELYALWSSAASRSGLTCSADRGVVVQGANEQVTDYLAKYGVETATSSWSSAHELTKGHVKRSAGAYGFSGQRYVPFDFLRWLRDTGELKPMELWTEYARAFKGKKQLVWSKGLRVMLELGGELSDEELAAVVTLDAILLAELGDREWRAVRRAEARGQLLELARAGNPVSVRELVLDCMRRYHEEP